MFNMCNLEDKINNFILESVLQIIINISLIFRFLDLTDDEKEKLRGSYKVAKKLDKLDNIGQDR